MYNMPHNGWRNCPATHSKDAERRSVDIVDERFELTADACFEAAKLIADFCSGMKLDRKDAVRCRLVIPLP